MAGLLQIVIVNVFFNGFFEINLSANLVLKFFFSISIFIICYIFMAKFHIFCYTMESHESFLTKNKQISQTK